MLVYEPGAAARYGYDPDDDPEGPLTQRDTSYVELSQIWTG